ncbi:MAG: flagellar hook-length control protein FliK [Proteobacteria bacterium]|nr:flagellar hook-length control protein FliK [Pseudomonadota bacterium]
MMPLSSTDTQVIKLINTPKLPAALFQNAQPIQLTVLSAQNNSATILLAGRQLQTQTSVPLVAGQQLTAQPSLVNGQLQLKLIPSDNASGTATQTDISESSPNKTITQLALPQQTTTSLNTKTTESSLPSWTNLLPQTTKEALASLKSSLPAQQPFQQILQLLSDKLSLLNSQGTTPDVAWKNFLNAALTTIPAPSAEKIKQSMEAFNAKLSQNNNPEWKIALKQLIDDPSTNADERQIAQSILTKTEQTQQLQNLHQATGQAVWLQEIPINTGQSLDNFTLEVDVPKAETPEQEQTWKTFVQLNLPIGDFTSRIQMDNALNIRLQLWGNNETLTTLLQTEAPTLKAALTEQGLNIESMVIAQGKPPSRTEQPLWQQPLVDIHS